MKDKKLHIVLFDNPFPPNYGGAIDIFYKIKVLHELGIKITLHVFGLKIEKKIELEKLCERVYYYKRKISYFDFFSLTPISVKSRFNKSLLTNLYIDVAPILFEGIQTTYILSKFKFDNRAILIRTHNIEDAYYKGLAKSEKKWIKKIFLYSEAYKLKRFENIFEKANYLLTISPFEQIFYKKKYGLKAIYTPVFHQNKHIREFKNQGKKILYHGDLRISDNIKVVEFLIESFTNFDCELVIASSFENKMLQNKIDNHTNIHFNKINNSTDLDRLFKETHIHILLTFQKTGIKLKLINSLYQGGFIIANKEMVEDTGLEQLCEVVNSKTELKEKVKSLLKIDFNQEITLQREKILIDFNTELSAKKIIDLLP